MASHEREMKKNHLLARPRRGATKPIVSELRVLLQPSTARPHVWYPCENFQNLLAAMDPTGLTYFSKYFPHASGAISGGRASFRDPRGKGNTVLCCSSLARAYIYGELYDEIDISRSHFTSVIGSFTLLNQPLPLSLLRPHPQYKITYTARSIHSSPWVKRPSSDFRGALSEWPPRRVFFSVLHSTSSPATQCSSPGTTLSMSRGSPGEGTKDRTG